MFSPPAYRMTEPTKQLEERMRWLIGIYNLLIHEIEAGKFQQVGSKLYELQYKVDSKWHPDAIKEFLSSGTIKKINQPINVKVMTKNDQGLYVAVDQLQYVYEINPQAAHIKYQKDFAKYRLVNGGLGLVKNAWQRASVPKLTQFHGTKMA